MPNPNPYWWEEISPYEEQPAELHTECDVVVVSAGLTGCSAALTLAKAGVDVTVADAEYPGFGASTRNGGMIGGGYRLSFEEMAERYGSEIAHRLLHESHVDSLEFAAKRIRKERIDCDYNVYGRFRGQWNSAEYDASARSLDELRKLVPVNIDMVPKEKQRREIGTDFYSGGMMLHDHGGLHPGKYQNGMLKAAVHAGARVFANTLVTSVERSGLEFAVMTRRGTIRAGSVIMATNGYTGRRFSWLKRRIIPVWSFVVATEVLEPDLVDEIMPGRRMCVETRHRHCYFRLSPNTKRLIFGGRAAMSKTRQPTATRTLHNLMSEIFPQLANRKITHSWTGQTGFSFSMMPHIGEVDGVWHALGYSGSGNAMAPYLGHKAALLMMGNKQGETAFTQTTLETRPWYRGSSWFLPFAHNLHRLTDMKEDITRGK
ncbi:MAG: FAD-binding oxidoreductase [Rhodobacteraceae bacterium]|nr:FAD-binding oxidoreductase [Paracoccaceae bacterium]